MQSSCMYPTFVLPALPRRRQSTATTRATWTCCRQAREERSMPSRRSFLIAMGGMAMGLRMGIGAPSTQAVGTQAVERRKEEKPMTGFQTRSGLKYFDFARGDGPTPKWGDLVNIQYVAYTISPSGESLVKQDSSYDWSKDGYLLHHGNGEMIIGLEEALHSMSQGGRRRAVIPRNLAYFKANLGPVPSSDRARRRFSTALAEGDGTVVFDIEIVKIMKDPDDRGYYSDLTPTEDEMRAIMMAD